MSAVNIPFIMNYNLKVCVLGSGSSGNCTYIASEHTRLLIDAGLSCKETDRRLNIIGADLADINALCISHEHDDHISSLKALYRKSATRKPHGGHAGLKLYANSATIEAIERDENMRGLPWNIFTTGSPFIVGDIKIEPFSVPHDSYDPVGFVLSRGHSRKDHPERLGIVTDMGLATELIRERLKRCRILILEANHDSGMLKDSGRPWPLIQRIAGRQGHLSNDKAAELITEIAGPELKCVFLAHLSSDCNRPELAVKAVRDALLKIGRTDVSVKLTYPGKPSDVEEV